jgi:multidrug efflux pump subunit AcrA (membrane-fusion protein)
MKQLLLIIVYSCMVLACKKKAAPEEEANKQGQTPVTITRIVRTTLEEHVDLNATAAYMQKNYVKANVIGYVQSVHTQPGKFVTPGQLLFVLKTKEAVAIGDAVNKLDPTFKFSGINYIRATANGYIDQLNHQVGDYVQDGEQLGIINDLASFAFVMDVPFELRRYVPINKEVRITLPDAYIMMGRVTAALPVVDATAQTQRIVIKVPNPQAIPESLIAKVRIIKAQHANAVTVPKAAVLTNDIQSEYWVMQLVDSVTAVKVPIKKGFETHTNVEILSPAFNDSDKIVLTGNFGLPDTAKVKITGNSE